MKLRYDMGIKGIHDGEWYGIRSAGALERDGEEAVAHAERDTRSKGEIRGKMRRIRARPARELALENRNCAGSSI
jgi:hypothetical protein